MPQESISMTTAMADTLIKKGSGDGALLYLYLLRHDGNYDPEAAGKLMNWSRARLDAAMLLLGELGLETAEPVPEFQETIPDKEDAPVYSRMELRDAIGGGGEFSVLYEQAKKIFNTTNLPDKDTRILLELYDHLGMPVEVLVLMVSHEVEIYQKKYHSSIKFPPMSYIRTTGYKWKKSGIDTLESADSYLKRLEYYESREGEMLAAVGIVGRSALSEEKKYIQQWIDWGFPPETVTIAMERTMVNQGKMVWSYCNGILRAWHGKQAHKPDEVKLLNVPKHPTKQSTQNALTPAAPITAAQQAEWDKALEESQRQLDELLKQM